MTTNDPYGLQAAAAADMLQAAAAADTAELRELCGHHCQLLPGNPGVDDIDLRQTRALERIADALEKLEAYR